MTTTYLDRLQGIETSVAVKAPVLVATTAAITLSGEQTIDGVALVAGDRVLVKDQASAIDNGIWDVSTGTWSRADDFNGVRDAVRGTRVFVVAGSTNSNTEWVLTTTDPEIGVTSLAFTANGFSTTGLFETLSPSGGDDASALQTLNDSAKIQFMFGGGYTAGSALTDQARPKILFADDATIGGDTIPMLSLSKYAPDVLPRSMLFVAQHTAQRDDTATAFFQRVVTTDDGITNPKNVKAETVITAGGGDQIEWAISGEVTNSDNTRSGAEGGTAVSGVARKQAANTGTMFGGHFQVKDETAAATVGGIVGAEINIQANGADTNGNRIGLDLIAKTYGAGTAGEFTAGLRIRNNAAVAGGKWTNALLIQDGNQTTPQAVTIENSPGSGTGYGISDTGTKAVGAIFGGTYGSAAIRLTSGSYIAMEATSVIKTAYGVTSNIWGFYNGANERAGFDMTATPRLRIAGTAVLGARRTGWAVPTGTATRTTFNTASVTLPQLAERVKGLIEDLHSTAGHGLIGT